MINRRICVCVFGLFLVKFASFVFTEQVELEIEFDITMMNHGRTLACDHSLDNIEEHTYTVLEYQHVKLSILSDYEINNIWCYRLHSEYVLLGLPSPAYIVNSSASFWVSKDQGGVWNCTIVLQINNKSDTHELAESNCLMQFHVRRKDPPHMLRVNKIELEPVRTDLSEKDIDFAVQYEYADNDIVDFNFRKINLEGDRTELRMNYQYSDMIFDLHNTTELSSDFELGFRTKLHSGHNNTYVICICYEPFDYTKLLVKLIMKTKFDNYIHLSTNGVVLRPKLEEGEHDIMVWYEYNYDEAFEVLCEIPDRHDPQLVVHYDFTLKNNTLPKHVIYWETPQAARITIDSNSSMLLKCAAKYNMNGSTAETIDINFIPAEYEEVSKPTLRIDLSPNGTIMEFYSNGFDEKRTIIYYVFEYNTFVESRCESSVPGVYPRFLNSKQWKKEVIYTKIFLTSFKHQNRFKCYTITEEQIYNVIDVIFFKKSLMPAVTLVPDSRYSKLNFTYKKAVTPTTTMPPTTTTTQITTTTKKTTTSPTTTPMIAPKPLLANTVKPTPFHVTTTIAPKTPNTDFTNTRNKSNEFQMVYIVLFSLILILLFLIGILYKTHPCKKPSLYETPQQIVESNTQSQETRDLIFLRQQQHKMEDQTSEPEYEEIDISAFNNVVYENIERA